MIVTSPTGDKNSPVRVHRENGELLDGLRQGESGAGSVHDSYVEAPDTPTLYSNSLYLKRAFIPAQVAARTPTAQPAWPVGFAT